MVACAASTLAQNADAVCLIDHHIGIVLLGQTDDLGQVGDVALHAEDAVHNDELHLVRLAFLELTFEGGHVIMLVFQFAGIGKADAFNDGGMVKLVPDDVILAACDAGDHSFVHLKTCGEGDGVFFTDEGGQAFLKGHMNIQRTVQKA